MLVFLGDYNLPSANISNDNSFSFDHLNSLDLCQYNIILNSNNIMLDYVISNCNSAIISVSLNHFPVVKVVAHHPPLEINLKI